jgi:hypothetical protein
MINKERTQYIKVASRTQEEACNNNEGPPACCFWFMVVTLKAYTRAWTMDLHRVPYKYHGIVGLGWRANARLSNSAPLSHCCLLELHDGERTFTSLWHGSDQLL